MKDKPTDIVQEIVDLYSRERMLAFFEFTLEGADHLPVSGLCRISEPKRDASKMRYLSLSFVMDTPGDAERRAAGAALATLGGTALVSAIPKVTEVMRMPGMDVSPETYLAELDLILAVEPGDDFVAEELVPAIERGSGIRSTDIVSWPAEPASSPPVPAGGTNPPTSLVETVRRWLRGLR